MPGPAVVAQEKSLRNCHLICSVRWGAKTLVPRRIPFCSWYEGPELFAGMSLTKSEYWTTVSFSAVDPTTQLWLRLIESKLLVLVAHAEWAIVGAAPLGWVGYLLVLYPLLLRNPGIPQAVAAAALLVPAGTVQQIDRVGLLYPAAHLLLFGTALRG